MANTLAELEVEINARFDKLEAGFNSVQASSNKTQGIFSAMSVAIGAAAVMVGHQIMSSLGDAMRKVTIDAANMADEILDVSSATGLTTDEVQKFKVAADMEGKSFESVSSMVKFYSMALKDAKTGTGDAADAFKQLGIDLPSFELMSTGQQLNVLLPAINSITNANDRMTIGQKLLGRGFLENLDLINTYVSKGGDLEAMVKKFAPTQAELEKAAQLKAAYGQIQSIMDSLAIKIAGPLAEAFTKLMPLVEKVATQIAAWLNNPENLAALDRLVQGIGNVVDNVVKLMNAWDSANKAMGGNLGILMNPMNAGAELLGKAMGFHAEGGIFTQPTMGVIGEAGPEAVIPLDRLQSGGGSSTNVTIQAGAFMGSREDARNFARMMQEVMRNENNTRTYGRLV